MKIYSMTATFGKLEHETLTLQPGLNVIEAPNEWGKSTWCAFLVSMLYGIDTRERTTGTTLAAKERYAPWSGAPMSGRIDLDWNGRRITIERSTRGRLIFGDFRAYETETGIEIPELNAANCGQMLLGVERGVFTQAGFLKLSDLPVQQNDALRRRLNALVTTGDESGSGERLAKQLKELKNKCRYNRTGLLPQAEAEQEQLMGQLFELEELKEQEKKIHARQQELETAISALENHKVNLNYSASLELREKIAAAEQACMVAGQKLEKQKDICMQLPDKKTLEHNQQQVRTMQSRWMAMQAQMLPTPPAQPELPGVYKGLTADEIRTKAKEDYDQQLALENTRKKQKRIVAVIFAVLIALAAAGFFLQQPIVGVAVAVAAAAVLIWCLVRTKKFRIALEVIFDRHSGSTPANWIAEAEKYATETEGYLVAAAEYEAAAAGIAEQRKLLEEETAALTGGGALDACQDIWQQQIEQWDALVQAEKDLESQQRIVAALRPALKDADKPTAPDTLTQTMEETDSQLAACRFEQKQLQLKLGQHQGRAEALGQESAIRSRLKAVNRKISQLEDSLKDVDITLTRDEIGKIFERLGAGRNA